MGQGCDGMGRGRRGGAGPAGRAGAAMATAAAEQGRDAAREEGSDGARDEAAAGAEETVKIICLGDSAVGKSKCVGLGGPAGSGGAAAVRRAHGGPCSLGRLLERFLLDGLYPWERGTGQRGGHGGRQCSAGSLTRRSRPQQLSTFALTLYRHRARVGEQEVRVGEWGQPGGGGVPGLGRCQGRGSCREEDIPSV